MSKIGSQHLDRRACVYVRQSTMAQVHQHQESTQRQYNLRQRAVVLGWQNVEVIDDDQGHSGKSADGRDGFQRLVSDVAMGRVGAIFGLEVSRPARSCVPCVDGSGRKGRLARGRVLCKGLCSTGVAGDTCTYAIVDRTLPTHVETVGRGGRAN